MRHLDLDLLASIAARFLDRADRAPLTPAERTEVLRIAQGFQCKDSASDANISPETIRARRKRIYRKVHVGSSGELIAALLAVSLEMLTAGERPLPSEPQTTAQPSAASSAAV